MQMADYMGAQEMVAALGGYFTKVFESLSLCRPFSDELSLAVRTSVTVHPYFY